MRRTFGNFDDVGTALRELSDRLANIQNLPSGTQTSGNNPVNAPGSTAVDPGSTVAKLNQPQVFTGVQVFKDGLNIGFKGGPFFIQLDSNGLLVSNAAGTRFVRLNFSGEITGQQLGPKSYSIGANGFKEDFAGVTGGGFYGSDLRNLNQTQIHFNQDATDDGGYLTGLLNFVILSNGVAYDGTNFIAKDARASLLILDNINNPQGLKFYYNTGLTPGNNYVPTLLWKIDTTRFNFVGLGAAKSIVRKAVNYTLGNNDYCVSFDTTTGNLTATLPPTPIVGQEHRIVKVRAANTLTLSGNGHNINGFATLNFATGLVAFDGTEWVN